MTTGRGVAEPCAIPARADGALMIETEICDWCSTSFPADAALYDLQDGPGTGLAMVVAACTPEHMLALGGRVHDVPRAQYQQP